jgi:hypothetical protein
LGRCQLVVALIKAAPDTRWWWDCVTHTASRVLLIRGRVHFERGGVVGPATFPSALVVYSSKQMALRAPSKAPVDFWWPRCHGGPR